MRQKGLGLFLIGLIFSISLTGCGSGGGSGTSITGQVVLNGTGTDQVSLLLYANGKLYMGDSTTADGHFSHAGEGYDAEFCKPGTVITFYFTSTDTAAFPTTCIEDYIVIEGRNDLGPIEIGTSGFGLTSPADSSSNALPVTFSWSAYSRSGVTPSYTLYFCSTPGNTIWHRDLTSTSCTIDSTDSSLNDILSYVTAWNVSAQYDLDGLHMRHYSPARNITLH